MEFMLLIYHQERSWLSLPDESRSSIYKEYRDLAANLSQAGKQKAGGEFEPTLTAVTVRVRSGKRETTRGPFEETLEQLAGFFLIEAKDMDEAIAVAAQIPTARDGSVEVRPVRS
jgi:hypothetical protein